MKKMFVSCTMSKLNPLIDFFEDEVTYKYDISPLLINSVRWDAVYSVFHSYADLTDSCGQFLRADLLGRSIDYYSNGLIGYIDEIGCDLFILSTQTRIELKSAQNIFPRTTRTNHTKEITMKNYRGNSREMKKTFDYLLLLDSQRVGLICYEKLSPHLYEKDDGVYAKIPMADIEFLGVMNMSYSVDINLTNIKEEIYTKVFNMIDSYKNTEVAL